MFVWQVKETAASKPEAGLLTAVSRDTSCGARGVRPAFWPCSRSRQTCSVSWSSREARPVGESRAVGGWGLARVKLQVGEGYFVITETTSND